jgi:hypothetical protein
VNDSYLLAPWGDALVANDRDWWKLNPGAKGFSGRRFCGSKYPETERLNPTLECPGGTNSGMQGMRVARDHFGATRILLCFFDMRGSTASGRTDFRRFLKQFKRWKGPEAINCTAGSALMQFPFMDLDAALRT